MRQYSLKGLDEIKRNEKNDKYFKLKCLVRPNQLLGVWAKSQKNMWAGTTKIKIL